VTGPDHQSVDRATKDEMGELFYTNAVAPIRLAGELAGLVKEGAGVLAFMSSRAGSVAEESSGRRILYRASKAALNALSRSFVAGSRGRRITVLCMHPGWVRTDMGGSEAPLDVATSAAGLADEIEKRAGTMAHAFVDYQGTELQW
jgi:NAD(P)-dependent dehydrogenase (short-subunit alcohol dehydrogenase family)